MAPVRYRAVDVDSFKIFYREAGPAEAPKLLLLHGFPSASHMFRDLIPLLADKFHMVAPDLPGFGQSDMPPREKFSYTFDNIAGDRSLYRGRRLRPVCGLCLRLRRADRLPARRPPSRADNRHHLAEWQRLRGGPQRRMDSDPGLLGRRVASEPKCAAGFPHAADNPLAVHTRRA